LSSSLSGEAAAVEPELTQIAPAPAAEPEAKPKKAARALRKKKEA
jgi:hypothetical protein